MTAQAPALRTDADRSANGATERRRLLVALFLGFGCAVLLFLIEGVAAASGLRGNPLEMLGFALLTTLVAAIPLIISQARAPAKRHVIIVLFALIYLAHYVVPVLTHYLPAGAITKPGNISPRVPLKQADTIVGQEVALVGLITLLIAYALPVGRWLGRSLPAIRRDWSLIECQIVALAMLAVGWGIASLSILGLLPADLGSGVISALASFHLYATVVLTYAYTKYRSTTTLMLLVVAVTISSVLGFFTGSKRLALMPLALVVLTRMLHFGRVRFRWIAVGILGLSLFYPTAIFYRYVILQDNTLPASAPLRDPIGTLHRVERFVASGNISQHFLLGLQATGDRIDALGITSVVVRDTPKVSPFQEGRTLVLFFYAFIPRALWPNKPQINIGQWITDTYGPGPQVRSYTGPTIIGDFYLNFGLTGVIFGLAGLGLFLRVLHEILLARTRTAPSLLIAAVTVFQTVFMLIGSVAIKWSFMVLVLSPMVAIHFAVQILFPRRPSRSPRARIAMEENR